VVANQYRTHFSTYEKTAKYWTEAFANPHSDGDEEKIGKIVEMGFDRAAAVSALKAAGGDENAALEALLGS
jgi:ubiquitin-conjugating enzyme (huntingtin interacting protein 2)